MRTLLIGIMFVFLCSSVVLAAQFGTPTGRERGTFSLSAGYSRLSADWDGDGAEFKDMASKEDQYYLQGTVGVAKDWEVYLRGGLSSLEAKKAYRLDGEEISEDYFEDVVPYLAVGFNGRVFDGEKVDTVLSFQGAYYDIYEDNGVGNGTAIRDSSGAVIGNTSHAFMQIEDLFNVDVGLLFQAEVEGVKVYFGPQIYYSRADAVILAIDRSSGVSAGDTDPIRESGVFGIVAGGRWVIGEGINLNVEFQKRSNANFSCSLVFDY